MPQNQQPQPHVVIFGAGVIGLTTALQLLQDASHDYRVTIIAAHLPTDEVHDTQQVYYASPWAGAHWRTHATSDDPEQCDWDVQSYDYFVAQMERELREGCQGEMGVKMYESLHYWDGTSVGEHDLSSAAEDLWWAPYVQNFGQLLEASGPMMELNQRIRQQRQQQQNSPGTASIIARGATCRAMAINVPHYLRYLTSQIQKLGGVLFRSTLPLDGGLPKALVTANGISRVLGRGAVDVIVNATGLAARTLCADQNMYPVRGQTVLVRGEAAALRTRYSKTGLSYCIPRPGSGTTILGGTKEVGVWSVVPDETTTRDILMRARLLAPELLTAQDGGFEVISAQCGLRPARKGGARVEVEKVNISGREESDISVVHAYGFGGAGYQNSIGVARAVVRLVEGVVYGSSSPSSAAISVGAGARL